MDDTRPHLPDGDPQRGADTAPVKDRLLAAYGSHLDGEDLSDDRKAEILLALWQIIQAFVDLGFRVGPGDNLFETADLSVEDVLSSIIHEETAPETVAPKNPNKTKETI